MTRPSSPDPRNFMGMRVIQSLYLEEDGEPVTVRRSDASRTAATQVAARPLVQARVQLWSCGGGRQSAGVAALILEGKLRRPDHVCMVALEWEFREVWPYVNRYIRPALAHLGIPFTAIPRKGYATRDLWGGADGRTTLLPAYTNQSGKASKLPEFCSGEWKREVALRWAAEQDDWKTRGVDNWVGISADEKNRRRGPRRKWFQPVYPLLDWKRVTVQECLAAVERVGWPAPPRSRCRHCPNQSDREWLELSEAELEAACRLEDEVRAVDPHAYFHKKLIPLRQVTFDASDDNGGLFGGCTSGACY